jgi:hypothetical protein
VAPRAARLGYHDLREDTPMTITIHDFAIETYSHMLGSLIHVLDKAAKHVEARKFSPADLAGARLAPDMFPLSTQVYLACHHAKDGVARLTGKEAPTLERGVQWSFEQLVPQLQATVDHVRGIPASAFDGAETRKVVITINPERIFDLTGLQFLRDWALPHFYFHVVTAYDILRDAGVEIGKRDYVPYMAMYLRTGG